MTKLGLAVISLLNNEYSMRELTDGLSSVHRVKQIAGQFDLVTLRHYVRDDETELSFYQTLYPETMEIKSEIYPFLQSCVKEFNGCDHVLFIHSDSALNDFGVLNRLLDLHVNEMAEYSHTENYPGGIGGEILSYQTIVKLKNIASGNNEEFQRSSISKIIHFDVNQYDVEVLVSERDSRMERLDLVCDNERNFLICQNALKALSDSGQNIHMDDIYELIESQPGFMRSTPAYIEIEITNECQCDCDICPRTHLMKRETVSMSLEDYQKIIEDVKSFCDEVVVAFTGMGEPTLHSHFFEMVEFTLKQPGITLIVESNGLLMDKTLIDRLVGIQSERLMVILALDSPEEKLYKELRSVDELKKVESHAAYLLEQFSGKGYIQILRLKENDRLLDSYYEKWKIHEKQIILQKYNGFRNQMTDRRGADLSPLKRFSCWHLKRDLLILADGKAAFCKQDINGEKSPGNVLTEGIKDVWEKMETAFVQDHKGNIDSFCDGCDEWFTYNF